MNITLNELFIKHKIGDIREDEYIDEIGLPFCKHCKTRRYSYFKADTGEEYLFRCLCKCQSDKYKEIEEENKKMKRLEEFRSRQKLSMLGIRYLDARFKNAIITKHNNEAFDKCESYCENAQIMVENNFGLYIYGDNSSGKTFLTACMCNYLIENGYSCLYTNMPTLIAEIQKSYSKNDGLGQAEIIDMIENKRFLFIDDLGKEFLGREFNPNASKFAEKIMLEVLNSRYNNGLPTIFSSNYSISELAESFNLDKAIMERINEMSTRVIKLEGDDFRKNQLLLKSDLLKSFGI